jgi:hypothetical protein
MAAFIEERQRRAGRRTASVRRRSALPLLDRSGSVFRSSLHGPRI